MKISPEPEPAHSLPRKISPEPESAHTLLRKISPVPYFGGGERCCAELLGRRPYLAWAGGGGGGGGRGSGLQFYPQACYYQFTLVHKWSPEYVLPPPSSKPGIFKTHVFEI
jgi:hypothetical protein